MRGKTEMGTKPTGRKENTNLGGKSREVKKREANKWKERRAGGSRR